MNVSCGGPKRLTIPGSADFPADISRRLLRIAAEFGKINSRKEEYLLLSQVCLAAFFFVFL